MMGSDGIRDFIWGPEQISQFSAECYDYIIADIRAEEEQENEKIQNQKVAKINIVQKGERHNELQ